MGKLELYVDGETVFERRGCDKCGHIVEAVSLWCGSGEAARARGTTFPGVRHCAYWTPDLSRLTTSELGALEEHGYDKADTASKIWGKIRATLNI